MHAGSSVCQGRGNKGASQADWQGGRQPLRRQRSWIIVRLKGLLTLTLLCRR